MLEFLTQGVVHYLIIMIVIGAVAVLGIIVGKKIRSAKDAGDNKKAISIGVIALVVLLAAGIGGGIAINNAMNVDATQTASAVSSVIL